MQTSTAATWAPGTTTASSRPPVPARPLLLIGSGVLAMALALVSLLAWPDRTVAPALPPAAATPTEPAGLTIHGPGDVTVLNLAYEAGESSGWHAHRGIHAVAILSGELAVYDTACNRTSYGPDNPYIGGQALHLIRNETGAAVPMVVTYLNPAQPGPPPAPIATPPACAG
ncbi:MAG: hypothetical protein ACLGI2_13805 [Acidimicrobiia bacterium]